MFSLPQYLCMTYQLHTNIKYPICNLFYLSSHPLYLSKLCIESDRVRCKQIYEEPTGKDEEFDEKVSDCSLNNETEWKCRLLLYSVTSLFNYLVKFMNYYSRNWAYPKSNIVKITMSVWILAYSDNCIQLSTDI